MPANVPYNERALHQQLLAGDQAALGHVFRQFYKRLFYFAFKVVENQMEAEDIVQEVFIRFWASVGKKQFVPDNMEAYLFRSVRNLCLNHAQRQRMIDEKNDSVKQEFYENIQQRMDELAVQEDLFYEIKKHFVHLTPAQAAVMQHLYVDDLSIAETAERMNTTAVNVRNHKARALERLRTILEQEFLLLFFLLLYFF